MKNMKEYKEINENLIDKKIILRMKENVIRNYYEKLNKTNKTDKEHAQQFNNRYKLLMGNKMSRKKNQKYKNKTKKK
jgi:hypothetical protein